VMWNSAGLVQVTAPQGDDLYQPWPVVLGQPELPLLGESAAQAGRAWGAQLNYQGVHMRLVTLDAMGRLNPAKAMAQMPKPGERFKLRLTATFEAVAEVGLVLGAPFQSRRAGQVYPAEGMSVQMRAGETVDLPLGANEYFQMGATVYERLLVNVRHPQANEAQRSKQLTYRLDAANGSSYLQLVPNGQFPAVEQLISIQP
jgi:hypothetical protein